MIKKYKVLPKQMVKFTDLSGNEVEYKMYRIQALIDIPSQNVKAGDLGGWVNNKETLSQFGSSWVGGEAIAYSDWWTGILRIKENALVTGNAVVYGSKNTRIFVGGNTIIKDNARVFIILSAATVQIDDNARLSELATVINPKKITGSITGKAIVSSFSSVLGSSHVDGNAHVSDSHISDMARITGNAKVSSGSTIRENAVVTDDAKVSGAEVRGAAKISGSAVVGSRSVVCDSAIITDLAKIGESTVIGGETIVRDNAAVLKGSRVLGKSIVSGWAELAAHSDYTDYDSDTDYTDYVAPDTRRSRSSITKGAELAGIGESKSSDGAGTRTKMKDTSGLCLKLDGLERKINAYGNDIVKILKFPVMNDLRDENTLEMIMALNKAKSIEPESNPKKFHKAVNSLERKFLKAESNALIISSAVFSDEQHKKAEKARDLFAIACNEVSSEQEKRNAFKQGFRQLVGVVTITDSAVENMRAKVGIPELEA